MPSLTRWEQIQGYRDTDQQLSGSSPGNRTGGSGGRNQSVAGVILSNPALNNFPEPRDYAAEYAQVLDTQIREAPRIYESEARFRPQYAQLDYDIFDRFLPQYLQTQLDNQGLVNDLNTATREAEIQDILELSPKAMDALRAANPEAAELLDEMTRQANEEVMLGGDLSADERRRIVQNTRAGFADRGMALSNPSMFAEVMNLDSYGRQRKAERRGFANDVIQLNRINYGDPWMAILGRPSSAENANQFIPSSMKVGPQLFDGESPYASSLFSGNQDMGTAIGMMHANTAYDAWNTMYNARVARQIGSMNSSDALTGSLIGAGGYLGGAAIMAMCWIARAAYGADNANWLKFRRWLLTRAPKWFVGWYATFGPSIAEKLKHDKPGCVAVREWMDRVLEQSEVRHAV